MNKDDYLQVFEKDMDVDENSKHFQAFKAALRNRELQIEMYWKRATYFWTFIAATIVGYGVVYQLPDGDKGFLDLLLACLGFILSLAWFLANRGSKYWQENWEYQVDYLQDKVTGPLNRLIIHRKDPENIKQRFSFWLTGPGRRSVSNVNQLVSIYIAGLWFFIIAATPETWNLFSWPAVEIGILGFTLITTISLFSFSGSDKRKPAIDDKRENKQSN